MYTNRALAYLRQEDFHKSIADCDRVIEFYEAFEEDLKAHFGGGADTTLSQKVEAQLDRTPVRRLQDGSTDGIGIRDLCPVYFRAIDRRLDGEFGSRPEELLHATERLESRGKDRASGS